MTLPQRTTKNKSGQALIEALIIGPTVLTLFSALFFFIVNGTHLFVWHHKVNKALLCSLDKRKEGLCLNELKSLVKSPLPFQLKVVQVKFERLHQRPQITVQLEGYFHERYKIKKSLSASSWKI